MLGQLVVQAESLAEIDRVQVEDRSGRLAQPAREGIAPVALEGLSSPSWIAIRSSLQRPPAWGPALGVRAERYPSGRTDPEAQRCESREDAFGGARNSSLTARSTVLSSGPSSTG